MILNLETTNSHLLETRQALNKIMSQSEVERSCLLRQLTAESTTSIQDLRSINVSSDTVCETVLRAVRTRLAGWNQRLESKPSFNWAVVQPKSTGRNYVEARYEKKKKSQWENGFEYACPCVNRGCVCAWWLTMPHVCCCCRAR